MDLKVWFINNIRHPILTEMEEFQEKDSRRTLHSIIKLEVNINKLNPMKGSTYIELPKQVQGKEACINVQNRDDNECFKWALLSAIHPVNKKQYMPNRVSNYHQYKNNLNFSGIKFPVAIRDVSKFEQQNDISVNIYGLIKKKQKFSVVPLHLTSQKRDHHVNLLRVEEEENYVNEDSSDEEDINEQDSRPQSLNFHYVWIKDLSRLVSRHLSKHDGRKHIAVWENFASSLWF